MEMIHYSFAYLRLFILRLLTVPVALTYIINDLSNSQFCGIGLLDSKDTLHIEIRIDVTNETAADNASFFLWSRNIASKEKIKLCEIMYSSPCSEDSREECYCQGIHGYTYTFVYKATARVSHTGADLFVNDEKAVALTMPVVYDDGRVTMSVDMNPYPLVQDCTVRLAIESTVLFRFCTYELEEPDLQVSYGGFQEVLEESSICLAVAFCIHNQTKAIEFTYKDKCGRTNSTSCIIEVYNETTTITTAITTATTTAIIITTPPTSRYSWILIFLIFCGLVILGFALAFIYLHLKESPSLNRHEQSVSGPDEFPASSVDAADDKRKKSSLSSIVSLTFFSSRKEKQVEDPRKHGTSVDKRKTSHT